MQPTRVFIPQLSKEAEAWYIWIWNIFKPFYEMSKKLYGQEKMAVQIAYNLLPMFGCEEVSFSSPLPERRIFDCRGIYIEFYVYRFVKSPRSKPKIGFETIENKINNELLVIVPRPLFTEIDFALGSQPTLDIDIGRFKVKKLEPFYRTEPGLNIYLDWLQLRSGLPKLMRIPINLVIPSYSTSPIGIVFTSTEGVWTKEQADVATKVLSAIYEQKRDEITGYVEKVSEFLDKIFRGLTTYLLY